MLTDSDSPLETICSSIVDAVIIADSQKKFVYWNESARHLLASGPHDVDPSEWAQHFKLFYVDSDVYLAVDDLPMLKALKGETYSDYLVMTKNSNHPEGIILSVNGKPIMEKGKIVGAFTTFRNITAKVRLENEVKKERAFFRNVLDLLPSLVCIKDLEGKYIYANKMFLETAGVSKEELIGRKIENVLHPEVATNIQANEKIVLDTLSAHDFFETISWGHERMAYFHSTRFPYFDSNGSLLGVGAVFKDVTKETETKLMIEQERNKTAHISKLAAIGILAAEIAHEIKNPLTIMRTNNEVIRYALREDEIDINFLNMKMNTQDDTIERIDRVASSLSMLSKDTSRESPVRFKLRELLDDIKALTSFRTRKINLDIEIISCDCLDTEIFANRVQLSEVLLNLVMNALDAIENVYRPKISIACEKVGQNMMMRVYDNGPGVSKVIVDKIFEPFYTTKDISKGTGLGLSIAKKIIHQHNGDLYYDHDEKGHCFVIQLPLVSSKGELR